MSTLVLQSTRPGASQNVAIGGSSTQSAAFATSTSRVRLSATGACHIALGTNPTATATSTYLPANVVEFVEVLGGEKVAVIQDGASTGNLNVTELS